MAAALLRRNPRIPFPRAHLSTLSTPSSSKPPPPSDTVSAVKSAIRSESDPDRIADLFQSSAHLPNFHGDRPIYKLSVQKLARSRRPDLVERLLEHQKSDPSAPKSEGFLIRIMTLYSDAGMVDHAVRTFDHMTVVGCPRTERSLCALLTVFLDNLQLDQLREAFERVPNELNISPGIITHNILLKSLCVGNDIEAARLLLDEMPKKGVKPDIVSYTTLLNGYLKKGDEAGFEEVLKEISDKGLNPNVVTYNCRISALCGKGKSSEAEELLDAMASRGIQPSRLSFNTLLGGFCKEGDVGSAMRVLERMRALKRAGGGEGASPNFDTYIILLQGLVEKGEFGSALEICKECLIKKWAPPFQVVKGLIDGLIKNSRSDEAKGIAAKMKSSLSGDAVDAWKKLESSFSF